MLFYTRTPEYVRGATGEIAVVAYDLPETDREIDVRRGAMPGGQVEKIGGLGGVLGMLPGIGKMKDQIAKSGVDDKMIKRQGAIISVPSSDSRPIRCASPRSSAKY